MDARGRGGSSHRDGSFDHKTNVKIEIDGWDSFSSLPSWRAVFLFTNEKNNAMDAHGGRLLETVLLSIPDRC